MTHPRARTRRTNSRSAAFGLASHSLPGVGFSGMTLTCTSGPERAVQPLAQKICPPRLVVDVADQRIFDRHPPARSRRRSTAPPQGLRSTFHRLLTGTSVSRSSSSGACSDSASVTLRSFVGQFADRRGQPDRRHRHRPRRDPETVRRRGDDAPHRCQHPVVVRQRLAHPHEHDIRQPAVVASRRSTAAARTCSRISAVDRLRVSPPWPVAQNGHAMPQPACDEMHTVLRCG